MGDNHQQDWQAYKKETISPTLKDRADNNEPLRTSGDASEDATRARQIREVLDWLRGDDTNSKHESVWTRIQTALEDAALAAYTTTQWEMVLGPASHHHRHSSSASCEEGEAERDTFWAVVAGRKAGIAAAATCLQVGCRQDPGGASSSSASPPDMIISTADLFAYSFFTYRNQAIEARITAAAVGMTTIKDWHPRLRRAISFLTFEAAVRAARAVVVQEADRPWTCRNAAIVSFSWRLKESMQVAWEEAKAKGGAAAARVPEPICNPPGMGLVYTGYPPCEIPSIL